VTNEELHSNLQSLLAGFGDTGAIGCVSSTNLVASVRCMFCSDCTRSYHLTHCTKCEDSSYLTQCTGCKECFDCAYCIDCDHSTKCNYAILCSRCNECDYCFACVGLAGKEFHILNKPYSRSEYFRITAELRSQLGIASPR
jgi:hypothetical protein